MSSLKVEGINLKVSRFGEADKLVIMFTRECGKIKVLAKGALKSASKFAGRMELFSYNELLLGKGRNFQIVSQCETIKTFYGLRQDPQKLAAGSFLLNLTDAVTEFFQVRPDIFQLLLNSLKLLASGVDPEIVFASFKNKILDREGIFPTLDSCVICGKKVPAHIKQVKFSNYKGGVICSACSQGEGFVQIPYDVISCMARFKDLGENQLAGLKLPQQLSANLNSILNYLISDHIGKDVTTL